MLGQQAYSLCFLCYIARPEEKAQNSGRCDDGPTSQIPASMDSMVVGGGRGNGQSERDRHAHTHKETRTQ